LFTFKQQVPKPARNYSARGIQLFTAMQQDALLWLHNKYLCASAGIQTGQII